MSDESNEQEQVEKRPAPTLGLVGPMKPQTPGPSTLSITLVLLFFALIIGTWFYGRYQLHQQRSDVVAEFAKLPDFIKRMDLKGVKAKEVREKMIEMAEAAGATLTLEDIELSAERIQVEKKVFGAAEGLERAKCNVSDYPQGFSKVPLTERTEFQTLLLHCRQHRHVLHFSAKVPIQYWWFEDVYVPERHMFVRRYTEVGDFSDDIDPDEEEDDWPY